MGRLSDFKQVFEGKHISNFIETGCYLGEGLAAAQGHFSNYYSCDISKKYVDKCKRLFPHADIYHLPSDIFLIRLLDAVRQTSLFWLDAHYPAQYDKGIKETDYNRFPLLNELRIIKRNKAFYEYDIIICDDLRVVQSDDNPVRGNVGDNNLKERHFVNDVKFKEYTDVLVDTHEPHIVGADSLLFMPKHNKDNKKC
jgi:hypothetical protein